VSYTPLNLKDVVAYVEANIGTFHANRLAKLEALNLGAVLLRKNPYLFRAKHITTAETLVKSVLDAFLSSQEETLFGNFMEGVAVFVCGRVFGGIKVPLSELTGIDLFFERDNRIYIVAIKSGPNWGNSSQIKKMKDNFLTAKSALAATYPNIETIAINGCMYGIDANPIKDGGAYIKWCGQDFWALISGSDTIYTEIIEPLGHQARERNGEFDTAYSRIITRFTGEFITNFCTPEGDIDWQKLVRWTSERRPPKSSAQRNPRSI